MRPEQKTFLTTAFEALGPARVTRGLEATGHSWNDCFLAIARYGEPGAFVHAGRRVAGAKPGACTDPAAGRRVTNAPAWL